MPVKDRKIELKGHNELIRPLPPPAPYLRSGLCSDCGVEAVIAGDGEMKICPRCWALLWHRDYREEDRRRRAERAASEKLRLDMLRKAKAEMKARAKAGSHARVRIPSASTMTLRSMRRRLLMVIKRRGEQT
jgi:hypothetical protein